MLEFLVERLQRVWSSGRRKTATILGTTGLLVFLCLWLYADDLRLGLKKRLAPTDHGMAIGKEDPQRMTIFVADFVKDEDGAFKRLVLDSLRELQGVRVMSHPAMIDAKSLDFEVAENKKQRLAIEVLRQTNATLLMFGEVMHVNNNSYVRLYWIVRAGQQIGAWNNKHQVQGPLELSSAFTENILGAFAQVFLSSYIDLINYRDTIEVEAVQLSFNRIRKFLDGLPKHTPPEQVNPLEVVFIEALLQWGRDGGDSASLDEVIFRIQQKKLDDNSLDRELRLRVKLAKSQAYFMRGERGGSSSDLHNSIIELELAKQMLKMPQDRETALEIYQNMSSALVGLATREHSLKRAEQAQEYLELAEKLLMDTDDFAGYSLTAGNMRIRLYQLSGDFKVAQRAIEDLKKSSSQFKALNDHPAVGRALHNLGSIYSMLSLKEGKDSDSFTRLAIDTFEEALRVKEEVGTDIEWANTAGELGILLAKEESKTTNPHFDRSINLVDRALHIASASGLQIPRVRLLDRMGLILRFIALTSLRVKDACRSAQFHIQAFSEATDFMMEVAGPAWMNLRVGLKEFRAKGIEFDSCLLEAESLVSEPK